MPFGDFSGDHRTAEYGIFRAAAASVVQKSADFPVQFCGLFRGVSRLNSLHEVAGIRSVHVR